MLMLMIKWSIQLEFCDNIGEGAAFHEFHSHPQLVTNEVAGVHLYNLFVRILTHYSNLKIEEF